HAQATRQHWDRSQHHRHDTLLSLSGLDYYATVVILRGRSCQGEVQPPEQSLAITPAPAASDAQPDHAKTPAPSALAPRAERESCPSGGSAPVSSWVTRASSASPPPIAAAAPRSTQAGPRTTL